MKEGEDFMVEKWWTSHLQQSFTSSRTEVIGRYINPFHLSVPEVSQSLCELQSLLRPQVTPSYNELLETSIFIHLLDHLESSFMVMFGLVGAI